MEQNEIAIALREFLKAARDYRDGIISQQELEKAEARYKAIVDMYIWRTD